jgi:hypothetical protein
LIGQNNAGKTTLIEALRLLGAALRRGRTAGFQMAPTWLEPYVSGPVFRFSVETIGIEHRSIHYNYNSDEPALLRARFSNNSIVVISVGSEETEFFAQLQLPGGKKINSRNHVTDRRFPPVNVMPPVGSLLDRETRRDAAYMRKNIEGYLSHRHIRNQMAALPDEFEAFRQKLEATWEHLQIGDVEFGLGEKRDEFGVTVRDGPFVSEMGLVGSGLQAWIQTLWFLARVSPQSTLVLDEPDIYLHADLQRKLVRLLASGDYSQTVIATHSLEMISAVPASEIISVTKRDARSRPLTSNAQAQAVADKLGTSYNLQLSKLAKTGRVLFVEGKDYAFLDQFAFKNGNAAYDRFTQIPHFAVGGMSNWPRAAMAAEAFHQTSDGRVKSLLVLDRDYKPDDQLERVRVEAAKQHLDIHFWDRKEIENYLICSSTIQALLRARSEKEIEPSAVADLIGEAVTSLGADIVELVADSYHAADRGLALKTAMTLARNYVASRKDKGATYIDLVSGKQVLSALSAKCKEQFGVSFSPMTVCRQMSAEDVHHEVTALMAKLI